MKIFLTSLFILYSSVYKVNFESKKTMDDWRIVVDGVMGGLSTGNAERTPNGVLFSGNISLANNGGFSSYRSDWGEYDFSKAEKVRITCRGKGQSFGFTLEKSRTWYMPNYKTVFTPTEEWQTFELPLKEFAQYQVGRPTGQYISKEQLQRILRVGFITASKKEGDFELEVSKIEFI